MLCHFVVSLEDCEKRNSINQSSWGWVGSICDSSVWKTCVSVSPARRDVENPKTRNHSKPMEKSMHRLHRCRTTVNDRFHRLNDGSNQSSLEHGSLLWRCGCWFVVIKTLLGAIFTTWVWWIESWTSFVWGSTLVRCTSRAQHRAIVRASGGRCRCQSLQQYAWMFNDFVWKSDKNDETTWNCMDHLERTMKVVISFFLGGVGGKTRFRGCTCKV